MTGYAEVINANRDAIVEKLISAQMRAKADAGAEHGYQYEVHLYPDGDITTPYSDINHWVDDDSIMIAAFPAVGRGSISREKARDIAEEHIQRILMMLDA